MNFYYLCIPYCYFLFGLLFEQLLDIPTMIIATTSKNLTIATIARTMSKMNRFAVYFSYYCAAQEKEIFYDEPMNLLYFFL